MDEFRRTDLVLTIRLSRIGKKKKPYYRVVVIERTRPRDGRVGEQVLGQDKRRFIANPTSGLVPLRDQRVGSACLGCLRRGKRRHDHERFNALGPNEANRVSRRTTVVRR